MNWDEYYLAICKSVAKNSKCLSRKIGAIIVKDKSIISTGYNGPPSGVPHCGKRHNIDKEFFNFINGKGGNPPFPKYEVELTQCPRYYIGAKSGEMLHLCPAGHAERNAIVQAAKHGIAVNGCTIYMDCSIPCAPCLIEIINSGIKKVVCVSTDYYDGLSKYIVENSDLIVRTYD